MSIRKREIFVEKMHVTSTYRYILTVICVENIIKIYFLFFCKLSVANKLMIYSKENALNVPLPKKTLHMFFITMNNLIVSKCGHIYFKILMNLRLLSCFSVFCSGSCL